jgi:hypothetical protein
MINMQLANKLGLSNSTIHEIIFWQAYRKSLKHQYTCKEISASTYVELWEQNEYRLQELWGFPKDPNYHRFWEMAGCTCPKMDNEDAYPTGYYTRSGNCPLHGEHTWQK